MTGTSQHEPSLDVSTPLCPACDHARGYRSVFITAGSFTYVCVHGLRVEPPPGFLYPDGTAPVVAGRDTAGGEQ